MSTLDSVTWADSLSEVTWPDDVVFIADDALPDPILSSLDDPILVPAGEGLKTLSSLGRLAERVLERRATRPLTLVAVGGGSVGDAIGFLSSVLWRGVALWHVPTTLLAMVDSAHGGKTAVNLGHAKNQLGTFYPADRVVICSEVLAALPLAQRADGLAELVKGLWLGDAPALDLLDGPGGVEALAYGPWPEVGERLFTALRHAVAVKYDVVARDPKETKGIRTWLNFGHTAAHALELEFGLAHGHAVAWGMAAAARVSRERGLDPAQADRLLGHVTPLLAPVPGLATCDRERFVSLVSRDKKRVAGVLRSVLLRGPGDPHVTEDVSPERWHQAVCAAAAEFDGAHVLVSRARLGAHAALHIPASKSELNRALVIAHLRPGETEVSGESEAADVSRLRRALRALSCVKDSDPVELDAGLGGTTLRFLLAVAALRSGPTTVRAHASLLARPHTPLLAALAQAGARVSQNDEGFVVHGTSRPGALALTVRSDQSSQFASALAMLAASNRPLRLTLTDASGRPAPPASAPYLRMTLDLLDAVGVSSTWDTDAHVISLEPRKVLFKPARLDAHADESSAAIWHAARALGVDVSLPNLAPADASRQPDRAMRELAGRVASASADDTIVIPLADAPDLAPVLTVLAALSPARVEITDAAHLRVKESNRIDDLVANLAAVGVHVEARPDGMVIPAGAQTPRDGASWPTHHDHRIAMAGLLLTLSGAALRVEGQGVVAKSYPEIWRHARALGWSVR